MFYFLNVVFNYQTSPGGSKKQKNVCHSAMSNSLQSPGLSSSKLLCPWNSPGKNTGVGSHSLLPGIFLMQGLNLHLLYCRQILCHPSHQESPRRVKPFVDSCSDFSDLCTRTGMHSDYVASLSFRDSELTEGGSCLVIVWGHEGSRESAWDSFQ